MAIKALLVGINAYQGAPLRGCVNDIRGIREVLEAQYGLQAGDARLLLDQDATGAKIQDGLSWLAEQAKAEENTTCLFYYSGHGSSVTDVHLDEPDGSDEAICPIDRDSNGDLIDDVLGKLYQAFKPTTHLVTIMDSCHSGDNYKLPPAAKEKDVRVKCIPPSAETQASCRRAALEYAAQREEKMEAFVRDRLATLKSQGGPSQENEDLVQKVVKETLHKFQKKSYGMVTAAGNFVLLAGCRSNQTSSDARFKEGYHGALSYFLLKALRAGGHPTYEALIHAVSTGLDRDGFEQIPQLECSRALRQSPFLRAGVKA